MISQHSSFYFITNCWHLTLILVADVHTTGNDRVVTITPKSTEQLYEDDVVTTVVRTYVYECLLYKLSYTFNSNQSLIISLLVIVKLLWDGTTSGSLSPSAAISVNEMADISTSLQAATVHANWLLDESLEKERDSLREPIEASAPLSGLLGAPVAVSSNSTDTQIVENLSKLKVGTWIRFRNLPISTPERVMYSLPSATATSPSITTRSKGKGKQKKKKDPLLEPTTAWSIGSVDPLTHISVLLPSFK